jgi:hypothetical protein
MVAAMTVQETTLESSAPDATDVNFAIELAVLDTTLDDRELNQFLRLTNEERTRIIIRVLCGLVAMGEPDDAVAALGEPDTGPRSRSLPHLGLERNHTTRDHARPRGWNTALLPFLGRERAY